jgi:isochorismate hydrolase
MHAHKEKKDASAGQHMLPPWWGKQMKHGRDEQEIVDSKAPQSKRSKKCIIKKMHENAKHAPTI